MRASTTTTTAAATATATATATAAAAVTTAAAATGSLREPLNQSVVCLAVLQVFLLDQSLEIVPYQTVVFHTGTLFIHLLKVQTMFRWIQILIQETQ